MRALAAAALATLSACSSVPTTGRANLAAKPIAYFVRAGETPTVVFQAGLGDGKAVWGKVIERLPKSASIFAYDRPGYGDSPVAATPRDPCTISRELHEVLAGAGVRPPYILVGHSLGGLYQFCYAKLFPQDVLGLVLLDPTHPNHWARMNSDAPTQAAVVKGLRLTAFSYAMRQEFDDQAACLDKLDFATPVAAPTRLLFSSQFQLADRGDFERMARTLRKEWLTLFADARPMEVSGSGHYVQRDAPQQVVDAIGQLVAK